MKELDSYEICSASAQFQLPSNELKVADMLKSNFCVDSVEHRGFCYEFALKYVTKED